jgi:hypothetical protein
LTWSIRILFAARFQTFLDVCRRNIMKGVLKKQGQVVGSDLGGIWTPFRWRERYFEERDDKLFYYKKQGEPEPKGFIDLKDIVKCEVRLEKLIFLGLYLLFFITTKAKLCIIIFSIFGMKPSQFIVRQGENNSPKCFVCCGTTFG